MRGPCPAAPVVITVNSLSRGPAMKSCSWLCWSTGPSAPIGVVPLPSLPRLSAQSCTYQCVKRLEPVGIGHHHGDGLAACCASATTSAAPSAAGTSAGGLPASTGASAVGGAVADRADVEAAAPRPAAGRHWSAPRSGRRRRDRARASRRRAGASRSRRPLRLPGLAGSVRPRKMLVRICSPAALHGRRARPWSASASRRCRRISRSRQSAWSRAAAARAARRSCAGSRLSMKCRRGRSRKRAERRAPRSRRAAPASGRRGSSRRCRGTRRRSRPSRSSAAWP